MRPDSDFDVVFPGATELAAIDEVETVYAKYRMRVDVHSFRTSGPRFLKRISEHRKELGRAMEDGTMSSPMSPPLH
jgi:hypothetical protein